MPLLNPRHSPLCLQRDDCGRIGILGGLPTLLVVMCNHCPYVQAVDDHINNLAKDYRGRLQVFGINANDPVAYPEDNFEAMIERFKLKGYQSPYLWDESQAFVRSLGAVCTPR